MLAAACGASLALTVDPYILRSASTEKVHEGLPLLLLGLSSALVYGLGFEAENPATRLFVRPLTGWTFAAAGALVLFCL
jgi:predicted membrane protein